MSKGQIKKPIGRPKKLDRAATLQAATKLYWSIGPTLVTIEDVAATVSASKPSIYREFGSDDGLKSAALGFYFDLILAPFFQVLKQDQPFEENLATLAEFITQDRGSLGLPDGCLHVSMRAKRDEFGAQTRKKIDDLRETALCHYAQWIAEAKSKGQFSQDIATRTAALFFDAQVGGAMRMQREGIPADEIKDVLTMAFSRFGNPF